MNVLAFGRFLGVCCASAAFRDGIFATFVPGVATPDAPDRKPTAFECAVLLNGGFGVVRTGGVEAAIAPQQRAEEQLVEADDGDEEVFHAAMVAEMVQVKANSNARRFTSMVALAGIEKLICWKACA
jgi:hypothetical protein